MWLPHLTCAKWLPRLGEATPTAAASSFAIVLMQNDGAGNCWLVGNVFYMKQTSFEADGVLMVSHSGYKAGLKHCITYCLDLSVIQPTIIRCLEKKKVATGKGSSVLTLQMHFHARALVAFV